MPLLLEAPFQVLLCRLKAILVMKWEKVGQNGIIGHLSGAVESVAGRVLSQSR